MNKNILEILKAKPKGEKELTLIKREIAKRENLPMIPNSKIWEDYSKLLRQGKIKKNEKLEKILRKRPMRTMSGIATVAVLTKPYGCPNNCAYCPNEPNVPKSYLSNEPAVMRAIRNKYDPFNQTWMRLKALEINGHKPTKIELIVIGGTWSFFPEKYKFWYIKECFRAANLFQSQRILKQTVKETDSISDLKKSLAKEQKKNEKAKYQIIGMTLETRPDYIDETELVQMRELGCTRVEIGVQATDDKILALNNRGHKTDAVVRATKLLRDFGFKVTYHFMPALPGSTPKRDVEMFTEIYTSSDFKPDQIKFYPTVVTEGSLLYKWWQDGKYKPYTDKQLRNLIIACKKVVPKYTRIIRLIRDIPGDSIIAGNKITNLRQVLQQEGVKCQCIRCRECGDKKIKASEVVLNIEKYPTAGGEEYFITFDSKDDETLYAFCRLRLPDKNLDLSDFKFLNNSAIIRELHVYGELVSSGGKKKTQHSGLGKRLIQKAEEIATQNGLDNMAIISGIGVRGYYKKLGYKLKDTYMVKEL